MTALLLLCVASAAALCFRRPPPSSWRYHLIPPCAYCDETPPEPVVVRPDAPLRIDIADEGGPLPVGAERQSGACEISEYVIETVDDDITRRVAYLVDIRATAADGRVYRVATRDFYFYASEDEVEAALDRVHPIGSVVPCLPEIARQARVGHYE